ncbi:MAG: type II toxin-antitoxin system RelE/ParE family toxin [Alphaproteobacteria bacterium]|nr:type II toxin-antitoxin system RelE/ParE family toxin [Alphaproteobacteria bacterium]
MTIRWTRLARAELIAQCDAIARDDLDRAIAIAREIERRVGALDRFPYRGRAGRVEGIHELPLPGLPWVAIYAVEGAVVTVLRLLHGAQAWPPNEPA